MFEGRYDLAFQLNQRGLGMILLDSRLGSGELLPYFRPYDVPVQLMELESSDMCFYGDGPEGMELVGFERKVLSDFMQSKRDNRLHGFQLPRMSESFPTFSHLILEGIWQAGESGMIETHQGSSWHVTRPAMMYRELDHFLAELTYKRGIYVERTANRQQTVAYVVSRYKFFNDQVWTQHNRTEKIYAPCNPVQGAGSGRAKRSGFIKRTVPVLEKMLMQVTGVEMDAYWVAKHCVNVFEIMKLSSGELSGIIVERNTKDGRKQARLGPAKAEKIFRALREL